jgi:hypothetical protein
MKTIVSTLRLCVNWYTLDHGKTARLRYHIVHKAKNLHLKSQWFSGKIRACHARAPCSIHGCDIYFVFWQVSWLLMQLFWLLWHL